MVRNQIGTFAIKSARTIGRWCGTELVVELNDHSIETTMEVPNKERRAWDSSLYKYGNVFVSDYANPIKPDVNHNTSLKTPDEIDVEEGTPDDEIEAEQEDDGRFVELISSSRYNQFMRQNLIEQMLNPREQWRLIVFGLIGLGALGFMQIIVVLYATGSF